MTGGTAPYTYSVDGGAYTTTVYTNLAAGLIRYAVTDANGCVTLLPLPSPALADRQLLSSLQPMLPAVLIMEHSPSAR